MEVLVLTANNSTAALFDVVLSVLQTSTSSIEMLSSFPTTSELEDHQLVVSRKRVNRDSVSAFIGNEQSEQSDTGPDASQLLRKIGRKSKKIKFLSEQVDSFKAKAENAMQKAQHLEMEQEQFFDDVQQMKTQYDKLAESHRKLMWEYLPARDPSLRAIPRLTAQQETPTKVGKYPLEQVLGYGQYAVVYTSSTPERPALAIKAIDKQKLVDLVSLHRISSEIASLNDPALRHPGILELVDIIHTRKHVYLVTERGGKDLFEFFGAHTDGVGEATIRPLLLNLAEAVEVLHRNNYCHRDLKPENVLYAPETPHLVKLIDFGLCTKAADALHDFCGSPGFFAPELLLSDSYDGCKADVWSIGCILLELVLGNTRFSTMWMVMYELSVLKEPHKFTECVKRALSQLRDFCHGPEWKYSGNLRSALLGMLSENPSERFSIKQLLAHPWLAPEPHSPTRRTFTPPLAQPSSHLTARRASSPIKIKSLSAAARIPDSSVHPLPESPVSAGHRSGSHSKLSLPSLSPDKPPSRCSPERKGTPDKVTLNVTRV